MCFLLIAVRGVCFTMQVVWTMETSDEESANSSENSYNEVVTVALAGGYAIMSTMMVPPQVNPPSVTSPDDNGYRTFCKIIVDALRTFACGLKISNACIPYYLTAMV